MPADLPCLIVAAESATADDEPRLLREVADALLDADLISSDAWHAIWDALNAFTLNEDLRPCLLGAALLLVPEGHGWYAHTISDAAQGETSAAVPRHGCRSIDWRRGATPALALLNASLRALQAAAGATTIDGSST